MFCIMLLVLNISKVCSQPEHHAMLMSSTVTYRQLAVASLAAVVNATTLSYMLLLMHHVTSALTQVWLTLTKDLPMFLRCNQHVCGGFRRLFSRKKAAQRAKRMAGQGAGTWGAVPALAPARGPLAGPRTSGHSSTHRLSRRDSPTYDYHGR
jgi:flagellar biosynthesis protein FlhB